MRSLFALVILAILLPMPLAQATYEVDTSPRTREYVHPLTQLVYHYDASTGVLTPTGGVATQMDLFIEVDVYRSGETPRATTGAVAACGADVCVSGIVAVVGSEGVRVDVTAAPTDLANCAPVSVYQARSPSLGLVTFYMFTWSMDACNDGRACAKVTVGTVVRAAECDLY